MPLDLPLSIEPLRPRTSIELVEVQFAPDHWQASSRTKLYADGDLVFYDVRLVDGCWQCECDRAKHQCLCAHVLRVIAAAGEPSFPPLYTAHPPADPFAVLEVQTYIPRPGQSPNIEALRRHRYGWERKHLLEGQWPVSHHKTAVEPEPPAPVRVISEAERAALQARADSALRDLFG